MLLLPPQLPLFISFDWDNTLADTRPYTVKVMQLVLDHYNLGRWDTVRTLRNPDKSLQDNFPILFGSYAPEAYELFTHLYKEHYECSISAMPGAQEICMTLKGLGIPFGIISSKDRAMLDYEVACLFNRQHFAFIVGYEDVPHHKPAPDPIHEICKKIGVKASRKTFWHIGDHEQDSSCALAAGVLPIIITWGRHNPRLNQDADNIVLMHSLKDLNCNIRNARSPQRILPTHLNISPVQE